MAAAMVNCEDWPAGMVAGEAVMETTGDGFLLPNPPGPPPAQPETTSANAREMNRKIEADKLPIMATG